MWLQAPEDDDPTLHMVSGPSSSVPPSMRPSPTPSQIELSKVRRREASRSLLPCCLASEDLDLESLRCWQPYIQLFVDWAEDIHARSSTQQYWAYSPHAHCTAGKASIRV